MRGVVGMEQDNTLRVWVKSLSLDLLHPIAIYCPL